ncbi:MarR family transcriptional regulator [Candidatus Pacearchaeota archaeon]|nr:MarR family transcriptional regulator [Candidatus Pacearchaeota archaeon]
MENKNVGWLILGISAIIIGIIFLFKSALEQISASSCSMEAALCPMNKTIDQQTYLSLAIVGILVVIGLVLIFSKPKEKLVIKRIKEKVEIKRKPIDYTKLDKEEKPIIKALEKAQGTMFQSDLVEKTGFDKVKVTRILDRLEGKQIIERKRRGMTNVVVLK